ncbi:MAG: potassium/proton antiporter [Myxococcales bacterium]
MLPLDEPMTTAVMLTVFGVLAGLSALLSRTSDRAGIPLFLLFLAIGMFAGNETFGLVRFDDYKLAFRLGVAALVLILFDGGLNTPMSSLARGLAPAGVLATVGVAGTAFALALFARLLGFDWPEALLVGSIVSSTDAAAVFAVLRGSGLQLQRRVSYTLELESGMNDPMAVILTLGFTQAALSGASVSWGLATQVVQQLGIGTVLGLGFGYLARPLLRHAHLPEAGLYPVLTMALAALIFGITTLVQGSGFMAVYLAGIVFGNASLPYKTGLLRVHGAGAWLSQVIMFLVLGLLSVPTRLIDVAVVGLALALLLAFLCRPVVVFLLMLPFRYPLREVVYICWIGLRGAVPIVLATFPVLAGVPGALRIFDVIFFIVTISALLPGGTVRWATRKLGLQSGEPPPPHAMLEITSTRLLEGEVLSFFIDPASAVSGSRISQLPFPTDTAVMLIIRGEKLIAPKGPTILQPGDFVYLFCPPEDRPFVQLIFGRATDT